MSSRSVPLPPPVRSPGSTAGGPVLVRPAAEVRALVAHRLLGSHHDPPALGDVRLMPHQWDGVLRLDGMLTAAGGALLADDAGLGKTYVALAIAARRGGALVIAPASLRAMWEGAAARARVTVRIASIESLGRGADPGGSEPLVIVDEAHHARNRATRRWRQLALRCATTPVLLLSATPLHNRRKEVAAQLALFLGERAFALGPEELARHVLRRTRSAVRLDHPLPALDGPHWITLAGDDDALLDRILALPAPLPPADGGRAGALLQWTLVRQWSSSRAAFLGALRRRLAQGVAMRESLERGVLPTRGDLAAWECADGAMQLAFPELLARGEPPASDAAAMLPAVVAHEEAVAALLHDASRAPDPDRARADALVALRARHPGARIIAFAERAATVERLWQLLRHLPGVAMLTSRGGEVAGGAIPRRELLARVASVAAASGSGTGTRATQARVAQEVTLLLTTDLLSEGANLQEASVVVHLDLPWSPARMEQRVGRVRRIGSPHLVVTSYAIRPPASTERLLQVERRLREKLRAAGRAIGVAGAILPGPVALEAPSAPERWASVLERLACWRAAGHHPSVDAGGSPPQPAILAACVAAPHGGGVALLERAGQLPRLLAVDASGHASDTAASLEAALIAAGG
ncbi:MAG TPA: helicase-related protein, partial [Gemmatimonadaceae bacterium]